MASHRKKMDINERAKQFMPFSPLNGLNKALRERELKLTYIEKPELFEEGKEKINRVLEEAYRVLEEGRDVYIEIVFFNGNNKEKIKGNVKRIDKDNKVLSIEHRILPFNNILDIVIFKTVDISNS